MTKRERKEQRRRRKVKAERKRARRVRRAIRDAMPEIVPVEGGYEIVPRHHRKHHVIIRALAKLHRKIWGRVSASLLLLLFASCGSFGHELCKREAIVSTALGKAGGYLGPPGVLVAEILSLGLGVACSAVDTTAHVPEALGLVECEECKTGDGTETPAR